MYMIIECLSAAGSGSRVISVKSRETCEEAIAVAVKRALSIDDFGRQGSQVWGGETQCREVLEKDGFIFVKDKVIYVMKETEEDEEPEL